MIGTDTDVGKTVVSALFLSRYRHKKLGYWKPIASGEPSDAYTIQQWVPEAVVRGLYHFKTPVSPHLAARLEHAHIDVSLLFSTFEKMQQEDHAWLLEGAGGLLTPLTYQGVCLADVLRTLQLPCVLVTRGTLGTLNHTCLTVEAAHARGIPLLGLVVSGAHTPENLEDLTRLTGLPLIDVVEPLPTLTPATFAQRASQCDPLGVLNPWT